MKKILIILFSILILVTSFSYAGLPGIRVRTEEKEPIQIDPKYDRLRGILITGFSIYFCYIGYKMTQGAKYEKGDVKPVGYLLLASSVPLFFWGIKLTFF